MLTKSPVSALLVVSAEEVEQRRATHAKFARNAFNGRARFFKHLANAFELVVSYQRFAARLIAAVRFNAMKTSPMIVERGNKVGGVAAGTNFDGWVANPKCNALLNEITDRPNKFHCVNGQHNEVINLHNVTGTKMVSLAG